MALREGGRHHHRPDAVGGQPAGADRADGPGALGPADGGDRRLQRPLGRGRGGAGAGVLEKRDWSTKFEMRKPRYTTQVSELPVAVA